MSLPCSTSTRHVDDLTYQRCDQENVIEQLQHGIAARAHDPEEEPACSPNDPIAKRCELRSLLNAYFRPSSLIVGLPHV